MDVYKKYNDFLTVKADQDVTAFLKDSHELDIFEVQIKKYTAIKNEITLTRINVPLNFYCLECENLNDNFRERVQRLKDRLVQFCIEQNREMNKSYVFEIIEKKIFQ